MLHHADLEEELEEPAHADLEEEEPTVEGPAEGVDVIGRTMLNENGKMVELWRFEGEEAVLESGSC